jgi:quinolinate synthase
MLPAEPDPAWSITDWAHALQLLKEERNAAILAHLYQGNGIEELADVCADTLQLLRSARELPQQTLVVAATVFVAESIKILCPEKQVLVPDPLAGCSLAESCPPELFARFRQHYPDAIAVVHIHTSAAVKALSDIVVTTGTAEQILLLLPEDAVILFAPDHELGQFLRQRTGRRIVCWFGNCVVHTSFSASILQQWRHQYPHARVLSSPQSPPEIRQLADYVGSSRQCLEYATTHRPAQLILATDHGLASHLHRLLPETEIMLLPAEENCSCTRCPYMRLNTLHKLYRCLREGAPQIELPEDLLQAARAPLERLLAMAP